MTHRNRLQRRFHRAPLISLGDLNGMIERLERRRLLTSNVYLDFGDNFPAGGLQMTALTLRNTFGSSGLQGPDLRQPDVASTPVNEAITDATNLNFAPTSPLVTF